MINPNATALLQEAITNSNASYDPMGAAQVVYVEARDETTIGNYILLQPYQLQSMVIYYFGTMWASEVFS